MATFDERARDWDTDERIERAAEVAGAIREAIDLSPSTRAIEIGAGTGLLGLQFAGDVGSLLLTDTSAGMLEVASEKVRRGGLDNVSVRSFDLVADPPLGQDFDLALSLLMLHHVEDTDAALRAVFGLLAPGGRLAMADLDAEDGTFHDPDAEGIHHQGFDRHALGKRAAAAGFVDLAFMTASEIVKVDRRYPLFLLTARRPERATAAGASAGTG